MSKSEHIKRHRVDPDALGFDNLRKEGINYVQELCGETWTDYNIHDPGVTILEQLCYGLTDLSYRSGFDVPDYLTNQDGAIDYQRHGLLSPQDILPSAPVTGTDYEKILYDAIPEIANIWFIPVEKNRASPSALYTIFVKVDTDLQQIADDTSRLNEFLGNVPDRLVELMHHLSQIRMFIDQVGHKLDTNLTVLQSDLSKFDDDAFKNAGNNLVEQGRRVLFLLDASLCHIDGILDKFRDIRLSMLSLQQMPNWLSALDVEMTRLEEVLVKTPLMKQFEQVAAQLPITLIDLGELIAILNRQLAELKSPLVRLESVLDSLGQPLSKVIDEIKLSGEIPEQVVRQKNDAKVKQKIVSFFCQNRNLCEDFHSVRIVQSIPHFLVGEIEILSSHNPAKIYAEIFFKSMQHISSGIQIDRYEQATSRINDYEQIFTGPLTTRGFIGDHFFEEVKNALSVVDLITLISRVDGVKQIYNLSLVDQEDQRHMSVSYNPSKGQVPSLCFPESVNPTQILHLRFPQDTQPKVLSGSLHSASVAMDGIDELLREAKLELNKLIFEYHAFRSNRPSLGKFIQLPKGQQRELQHYYSIQNHFPAIYGINQYGIPRSKPDHIKAKAKQLKAYLFPYEQLMANYLKNLDEIPRLFSLDRELKQSYFSQYLSNTNIPGIEEFYTADQSKIESLMSEIVARYDDHEDRRSRVLDTMLAIYGEQFQQQSLRRFNHYRKTDTNEWVIENKINFLKCIKEISQDRAKGFDYLSPSFNSSRLTSTQNVTGLHKKLAVLLGLYQYDCGQLITQGIIKRNSFVLPDKVFAKKIAPLVKAQQSEEIPPFESFSDHKVIDIPSELPGFSHTMFKHGIALKNYRIVRSDQEATVCFSAPQEGVLWPLVSKNSFEEAVSYAQQFCQIVTRLNMECESFHIIEHLLLRPRGCDAFESVSSQDAFYDFRVSVIFPSWTARFSDQAFRKFAEETVQKSFPAHVFPDFYWLDFIYMQDFEQRYCSWLKLMQTLNQENKKDFYQKLDLASEKIISFLLRNRKESGCKRWI